MLTPDQEKYLLTIPPDKLARLQPFDPVVRHAAEQIIVQIKEAVPGLEVFFGGASALGIAGQNDIDLNVLSSPLEYAKYLPALSATFGPPARQNPNLVKWEFSRDGFDVELYLTDRDSGSLREQIRTFELLRDKPKLREEYERLKLVCNGLPLREYMRQKYEFFNKILKKESA